MWNEEIMGQLKWTTANHTKGQSSSKDGDVMYMVRLEGSPLFRAPSRKPISFNKYCSRLELKTALNEKHPELVNRKRVMFHQGNARPHISLKTRQKLLTVWLGSSNSFIIAPLDFYLFQSLQDSLNGQSFSSLCVCSLSRSVVSDSLWLHRL